MSFDTEKTGIRAIKPETSVKVSIAVFITIGVSLVSLVWAARGRLADFEFEQKATRAVVNDLPKRAELEQLERRVTGALRRQMKNAILRCPRQAARSGAGAWMDCQVIFPQPPEE